ncbi:universal stress protein [Desulfosarcina variabilis str. Montpellier]|jgi:nucleotide-binding universal stress UspA family protein|uniref:universal stress protein n=1 Tax=Desulfosarcina variabilis TaxID=2300 RepID=UPI003AFB03B8
MYKTILVPLDGSQRSEEILPHVESLALHLRSSIILLYVDETADLKLGHDEVVDINQFMERHRQQVKDTKAYFQTIIDKWRTVGIIARMQIRRGSVVANILDTAKQESVDLVAMASHGKGGMQRAFYGSVAVGVLNQIDRPLLLIRSRFVKSTA